MHNDLKPKYGLLTAIAMVVGIVIGSGVFFKAEKVLNATGGNLPMSILAWAISGIIMIICAYTFATLATKYNHVSGIIDYAEALVGKRYSYYLGWFLSTTYYPAMTSVLAWVAARYIGVILGFDITGGQVMTIAGFLLVVIYAINALSPVIAGKFQVSATIIKLIPLLLMAVAGTIVGLSNGSTVDNFITVVEPEKAGSVNALLTAVIATVFAYEGWICATSINAELKNPKKNLPLALVLGTVIVALVYILYSIGLSGGISNAEMMENGEHGAKLAFMNIFGDAAGIGIFVLVVVSCLGTLNGLMVACTRSMYALSSRNWGPKPKMFSQVDSTTNMPSNSAVIGLITCAAWLLYFYGANLSDPLWFGPFCFDSSEIPLVTIYAMYIPLFVMMIIREKELSCFKRFVMPAMSLLASLFMIYATIVAHGMKVFYFLIILAVIMASAIPFYRKESSDE